MFFAADDITFDTLLGQRFLQFLGYAIDNLALVALALLERLFKHPVAKRVQVHEAEVFQPDLQAVDTQPVGDRRVDVESFPGNALLLFLRHCTERFHVVQPIGKFYENDPNILDHRHHHLAEAFGLHLLAALKTNLIELADTVDKLRNFLAELHGDFFERGRRVLDDVMQNRGGYCLHVQVHVGEFLRHGDRVCDVRFAGLARLPFVRPAAKFIRFDDLLQAVFRQVGFQRFEQPRQAMVTPGSARELGQ